MSSRIRIRTPKTGKNHFQSSRSPSLTQTAFSFASMATKKGKVSVGTGSQIQILTQRATAFGESFGEYQTRGGMVFEGIRSSSQKSVFTEPGFRHDTFTPVPNNSRCNASESPTTANLDALYPLVTGKANFPEPIQCDKIYHTNDNRKWCRTRGIRMTATPKGPTKKHSAYQKRKRHKEYAERNHIEGRIGNAKQALSLNQIKAKLQDTSETWIAATLFVLRWLCKTPAVILNVVEGSPLKSFNRSLEILRQA